MKEIQNIVLLGTGNVGTHVSRALKQNGFNLLQVFSRQLKHTSVICRLTGAEAISDIKKINTTADLYIIAIPDSAIEKFCSSILVKQKIIVHTSGTLPVSILEKVSANFGCIYPVQSFSKNVKLNFNKIPLCIEANNEHTGQLLFSFAKKLSTNVQMIAYEQRRYLHIAAVFANNFSNFMFHIADEILNEHQLSLDLLKPLILETTKKISHNKPFHVQTGPAIREDMNIISEHLRLLENKREYRNIYNLISQQIIQTGKKNEEL